MGVGTRKKITVIADGLISLHDRPSGVIFLRFFNLQESNFVGCLLVIGPPLESVNQNLVALWGDRLRNAILGRTDITKIECLTREGMSVSKVNVIPIYLHRSWPCFVR